MRFRADVYDKLYPRPQKREAVESNVDSFKPSEVEQETESVAEVAEELQEEEVAETEEVSEGEVADE